MNIKNSSTFFQWLECYEFMTKREFKKLPAYKQENYKLEYKMKYKAPKRRTRKIKYKAPKRRICK